MDNIKKRNQPVVTNAQREMIEAGLMEDFGFEEVRFDDENGRPYFGLRELQTMLPELCPDLTSTELEAPYSTDGVTYIVRGIFLYRTLRVARSGQAAIGEPIPNKKPVNTMNQATGLAEYRAFVNCLDGCGVDVTKLLLTRYCEGTATVFSLNGESEAIQISRMRVRLDSLLRARGYITQSANRIDRTAADKLLMAMFDTSNYQDLTLAQLKNVCGFLQNETQSRQAELKQAA